MWKTGSAVLLLAAAAVPALTRNTSASSSGPPPARTGGFGEMTCHECHWENPVNDPPGALTVSGVPPTYTPGEAYTITVSVSHPVAKRTGFELSARFGEQAPAGVTAGQLRATDARTRVVAEKGVSYILQTEDGSKSTADQSNRWTFEWTAPTSAGTVVFHTAANAANGDASPLGDYVYTATATSAARRP